jgi:hypothetical protein
MMKNNKDDSAVRHPIIREILAELEKEENDRCSYPHWGNWNNWINWGNWANWNNWGNWANWWT